MQAFNDEEAKSKKQIKVAIIVFSIIELIVMIAIFYNKAIG